MACCKNFNNNFVVKLTDIISSNNYYDGIHQIINISEGDKMRQLTKSELDHRIASFMRERLAEHPELEHTARADRLRQSVSGSVVSRVKEWGDKLSGNYSVNSTLYQV